MTITTWPVTGQNMSDVQWAQLADWFAYSGVIGGVNGVGFEPYITAGVGLFAKTGKIISRGVRVESDAPVQASIPSNAGGTNRLDLWTWRSDLAVSPVPTLTYVTGGSTYPAVRRDSNGIFDVPIAFAVVPSGATVPSSISDARTYIAAHVIPCRSVNDVDDEDLRPGTLASGSWGLANWTGQRWDEVYTAGAGGAITLGANFGTFGGQYKSPSWRRDRNRVYLSGVVKRTGPTIQLQPSDADFRFTGELPTSYRPDGVRMMVAAAGSDLSGMARGRVIYKPGLGLHYQPGAVMTLTQNTGYIALDGLTFDLD